MLIDLPLPVDQPVEEGCGKCVACMTICPTGAIVEPYTVDARRCISYLTIELEGAIPEAFRPLIGNRIYGCDDCQLICPWNRYSQLTDEADFSPRKALHNPDLVELFSWSEAQFLKVTEGSAIRRIGHLRWLRNVAVALGMRRGVMPSLRRWKAARVSIHFLMSISNGRLRNKLKSGTPASLKCSYRKNSVWSG
ncbi:Fe-S protein [Salmonella enterica subsp. enterica serovar Hartford]|nr:Fe-S protein [Salmonella enterica subsp. enterica serovar Hartford]